MPSGRLSIGGYNLHLKETLGQSKHALKHLQRHITTKDQISVPAETCLVYTHPVQSRHALY